MANNQEYICIINDDNNNDGAASPAATGSATRLNFKVEPKQIHNFWQKGKVTISVMDYICRIKDLIKTNNWLDTAAYNNLANV